MYRNRDFNATAPLITEKPARSNKRRPARIYSRTSHQLRELERIISSRHGVVPDTDDAGIYLDQVACCLLRHVWKKTGIKPDRAALLERLDLWCDRRGPDVSAKLRRDVVRAVLPRPRLDNADDCARRLRLSYDERTRLGITTIGAYDANKRERARLYKARKKQRDRLRVAAKRADAGALPRAQYLATSLSATRPWEAEGISRRTWERRRRHAATVDASVSPTSISSMLGDGLATRSRIAQRLARTVDGGTAKKASRPDGYTAKRLAQAVETGPQTGELLSHRQLLLAAVTTVRASKAATRPGRGPYRAATRADDASMSLAA